MRPLLLALLLSACASPQVHYDTIKAADDQGRIRFQLTDSIIKFEFPTGKASLPDKTKLTITVTPVPDKVQTITIAGAPWYDNWGNETQLTSTHTDSDPLLLTQVGSAVSSDVVTALKTAGDIAATLIPYFAAGVLTEAGPEAQTADSAPDAISLGVFLRGAIPDMTAHCANVDKPQDGRPFDTNKAIICTGLPLPGGKLNGERYTADVSLDAVPVDALWLNSPAQDALCAAGNATCVQRKKSEGQAEIKFPYSSNSMIYSACRTLTLKVHVPGNSAAPPSPPQAVPAPAAPLPGGGGRPGPPPAVPAPALAAAHIQVISLVVADSHWVETTAFPPKGNVKLSASCGADAVPTDFTPTTPLDVLNAAVQAAKTALAATKK